MQISDISNQPRIIKVAIIGFGRIGQVHVCNVLKNFNYELKYLIELDEEKKKIAEQHIIRNFNKFKNEIKVISYDNFDEVLNDSEIDAVFVCSSTAYHFQQCIEIARAKKHIFCEKPISLEESEIKEAFEEAERNKVHLFCALNRRHDPFIKEMKKLKSKVGQIHSILTISRDHPYPEAQFLKTSGGLFHDCAIHDIDMINWILESNPEKVMATGSKFLDKTDIQMNIDNASIQLFYPNNVIARINLSRISTTYDQRLEIYGTERDLFLENILQNPIQLEGKKPEENVIIFQKRYEQSFINEINHFYELINNLQKPLITKEECIRATQIAKACEKSFINQKIERIDYSTVEWD